MIDGRLAGALGPGQDGLIGSVEGAADGREHGQVLSGIRLVLQLDTLAALHTGRELDQVGVAERLGVVPLSALVLIVAVERPVANQAGNALGFGDERGRVRARGRRRERNQKCGANGQDAIHNR